jgi:hypothetical protein
MEPRKEIIPDSVMIFDFLAIPKLKKIIPKTNKEIEVHKAHFGCVFVLVIGIRGDGNGVKGGYKGLGLGGTGGTGITGVKGGYKGLGLGGTGITGVKGGYKGLGLGGTGGTGITGVKGGYRGLGLGGTGITGVKGGYRGLGLGVGVMKTIFQREPGTI